MMQGMLTCLLGNLTLLSYFAKKKEKEAILVQTLGVVSIYIVIVQLAVAGAMPLLQFTATSAAVVAGLVLNFMNYYGWLLQWVWQIWEDFITIVGISVLPQVMWSTFVPYIPSSNLPGLICCSLAIVVIILVSICQSCHFEVCSIQYVKRAFSFFNLNLQKFIMF
ncbi:maltose excess protein 1-like, chloroplastic [Phalaenopsis equestris]|uniref:maltose excess protein 1-like, chloroplastic n=1 Tax=Phalaenopsis equestris TaxID=78828 RepID=UPI0009E4154F|nr:maltose excess protein 1-like, chloroplastic [Phalaenopsis equestris]